jgi:hypothetical protein
MAIIVILVSAAVAGLAGLGVAWVLHDRMFVRTYAVPSTFRAHLHDGTWNLYGLSGGGDANDTGIDPAVVTVEGPAGSVPVHRPDNFVFSRGSDAYRAVVEFDAPTSGNYVISVQAGRQGRVMLAPSIGDLVLALLPWLVAIGVAFLVQLLGWVLLIVGVTRRQRARKTAWLAAGGPNAPTMPVTPPGPMLPPPGWHPDPYGTHRLRWWDGRNWTDQFSD